MKTQAIQSISSVDLKSLKARANALKKSTGINHSTALECIAGRLGLSSWHQASELLRLPFLRVEFHRIRILNIVLILWASTRHERECTNLYVDSYDLPDKPVTNSAMDRYWTGQSLWSDIAALYIPKETGKWAMSDSIYNANTIDLPGINQNQAEAIAKILGVKIYIPGVRVPFGIDHEPLFNSPIFQSVKRFARQNMDFVQDRSSEYLPDWGARALE